MSSYRCSPFNFQRSPHLLSREMGIACCVPCWVNFSTARTSLSRTGALHTRSFGQTLAKPILTKGQHRRAGAPAFMSLRKGGKNGLPWSGLGVTDSLEHCQGTSHAAPHGSQTFLVHLLLNDLAALVESPTGSAPDYYVRTVRLSN